MLMMGSSGSKELDSHLVCLMLEHRLAWSQAMVDSTLSVVQELTKSKI
jgi:hypothetical protein